MNVYLDNNGSTKISSTVLESMMPYLCDEYGNPSSTYSLGERASKAVYNARNQVASLLNSMPQEIFFTGSGTESDNMAIRGVLDSTPQKRHIITSSVEHPAVRNLLKWYEKRDYKLTTVSVDSDGRLDLDSLASSITDETALISIMYVNNETGIRFDLDEVGRLASEKQVPFHIDAIQAAGKIRINVKNLKCDLLSISAHKFHGPKGVGALYVRSGFNLEPLVIGGGQEGKLRAGTENVAGIVGMGKASEEASQSMLASNKDISELRDFLEGSIFENISNVKIIGRGSDRISNTSSILFEKIDGDTMLLLLNKYNICASMGSACHSGALEPSYVLSSMGMSKKSAKSTIRFSLSKYTTRDEIDYVIKSLIEISEKYSK